MVQLINAINTTGPANIDERIKDKVLLAATSPISENVARYLGSSLWAVAEQLDRDGLLGEITTVTCIFTSDGDLTLKMLPQQFGVMMRLIVYPMSRWEKFPNRSNKQLLIHMILIEELAHHFWNIEDEIKVKYKVIEIMKHIFPDVEMSDVYSI